jgi:DNA-binding NtrC family response regulator
MTDTAVPLIVLTTRQDDVDFINRTMRDAGHAVRCKWIKRADAIAEALVGHEPQLMLLFSEAFTGSVREIAKIRQSAAPMVPLVVVQNAADETAIADAMLAGAQDLVSKTQAQRLRAVAERELRAFRLERALNETLNSATQYRKELKAFMAGSVDAIVYVLVGIVVDANQAWADLFSQPDAGAALGPLMVHFDGNSQAAL